MAIFKADIECTIKGNFLDAINAAIRCWLISFGKSKVEKINIKDIKIIITINVVLSSRLFFSDEKLISASSSNKFSGIKGESVIPNW